MVETRGIIVDSRNISRVVDYRDRSYVLHFVLLDPDGYANKGRPTHWSTPTGLERLRAKGIGYSLICFINVVL